MISLKEVSKSFGGQAAVRELSLQVDSGQICCLLGPSGCGKTTSLKMINRMIEPSSGEISIEGRNVKSFKPHILRRKIGYVIQSIGLFPHMSVLENICVVPRLLKWDHNRARRRGRELLELLSLDPDTYGPKHPHELSGGQAQRIGVARALAADPDILLMDEPFGALDPLTRTRLQAEFATLQRELGKTVVLVTHDVDEAVFLGSTIALMHEGRLVQLSSPVAMLAQPVDDFVRRFFGADRVLKRLGRLRVRDHMRALREVPGHGSGDHWRFAGGDPVEAVWLTDALGRLCGLIDGCPADARPVQGQRVVPLEEPEDFGLSPDIDLKRALTRLLEEQRASLPVVREGGRLQGEVRLHDIIRA